MAFMGDLVPVRTHPSFAGDPDEWLRILARIEQLDIQTLVPGHGPVGTLTDCATTRQYIAELKILAEDVLRRGGTADDAVALPIPSSYAGWDAPTVFPDNMRFLYQHAQRTSES
jgi:glyoxylase-like metal-dependent hydrolase (beta-lactamase superfamily II)